MTLPARVGISGLGLIGGSVARGLAERAPECALWGADPDETTQALARESGLFAGVGSRLAEIAGSVEMLVLAGPIPAILDDLAYLPGRPDLKLVVTDVGSTKATIVARASALPASMRFVGGHPMAGSEKSGFPAGNPRLFENASWVLCPVDGTGVPPWVMKLVASLGARAVIVSPGDHDRVVAATSHLPLLVAVALGNMLADLEKEIPDAASITGGGFRDLTRIAESSPAVWKGILGTNEQPVADAALALGHALDSLRRGPLAPRLARAASLRARLLGKPVGGVAQECNDPARSLDERDLPAVLDLWRAAGLSIRPQGRDALPTLRAEIASGRNVILGWFDGDALVGAAVASDDLRKGWINRVAVLPSHRRRGIGAKLVARCERLFASRGIGLSCSLVEDANHGSLALFRAAGYEECSDIGYLRKRLDPDW